MGWIPRLGSLWMVIPSISALNFVSVTPYMGILFPNLRRNEVSTLWSSFFLSFMWFVNCILVIPSFWALKPGFSVKELEKGPKVLKGVAAP